MKFKNILLTSAVALSVFAIAGCSKAKFDINSNPDDVTDISVTPSVLLPGALQATSSNIAGEWWFVGWWMGHGARSGSFQSFNEEETYSFTNDFHVAIWNQLYANANNYNLMVNKAQSLGAGTYEAIGRIMKSHCFQMLVDTYGNIPYSEAFQGTVKATPKYDKAVDVYNGIFADLDAAIALLNDDAVNDLAKNPDIATADLVYKGNRTMWKKFANTLRLRMLVHLHNGITTTVVAPGVDVPAQVAKITSDGFLGAGESAHLNPGFTGTKPQPYYRFFNTNESGTTGQRDWAKASAYAVGYYQYNGDYRLGRFYTNVAGITNSTNVTTGAQVTNMFAAGGPFVGIVFGTPSGGSAPTGGSLSSVRGLGLSPDGAQSRAWILTSVESLFLQAEARERGVITTGLTAKELLTAAIQESFVWLNAVRLPVRNKVRADDPNFVVGDSLTFTPVQTANFYIENNATYPDVDYDAVGGGLFTILSQKWFALNSIATYELWTDYRRTGIEFGTPVGYDAGPTISVDPNNTKTEIPVRLFYPQNEYNYNAASVGQEGTINVFTNKIFWDVN